MGWRRPPSLMGGPTGGDPNAPNAFASGTVTTYAGWSNGYPLGWANQPAATTRLFGDIPSARYRADFTGRTRVRLVLAMGSTLAATGARAGVRFSLDEAVTWLWADGSDATPPADMGSEAPQLPMDSGAGTLQESAWQDLHASLRGPVLVEFVADNGNGVADPTLVRLQVQAGTA